MIKKQIILFLLTLSGSSLALAQKEAPDIYKGNEFYRKQQFDKAAEAYQQALKKNPRSGIANFNAGNATFRQNKFDEALNSFDNTISNAADKDLQQQAFYNKGVAFSKEQRLEESIEAWKKALQMNPADKDTRENLEKALRALKKKKEEEKKQKDKQQQKKQQEKQQEKPKQQSKLSQQRVEQLLKALQQKEKEVNDKLNQNKVAAPSKPEKDW
jgi:Ca-activated chloride channel family protein